MCGICGFSGDRNQDVLQKMGNTIIHRGPDEGGAYSDGIMNLCSRRLSIVDLQAGSQPIHNEDKSLWIVWNGELYNHKELREELISKGHQFYTSHSDTEVILHMYEEYKTDFFKYLNGMFAIAIWDKSRQELLLARDRMGVKPLYYAIVGNEIIFASEIKAILQNPKYQARINSEAIYHYFSFKNTVPPQTAFQGISAMLPGHYGIWNGTEFLVTRYWKIDFHPCSQDTILEAKEKIRELIVDATLSRIYADVDIGSFLSGGLDSSLVTAIMAKGKNNVVKTFSLCYEARSGSIYKKDLDEICAKKVSQLYGTQHYEYLLRPQEVLDCMEDVVRSFDQPFSGVTSTYFISKLIRKHVKVALSGDGADELFGSYLAHRLAIPFHNYARERVDGQIPILDKSGVYASISADYLERMYCKTNGDPALLNYQLLQIRDDRKKSLFTDSFQQQLSPVCNTLDLIKKRYESKTASDPLNMALEYDWNGILANQVLPFVDFLSMANSLEVRSPFLDYRLVEYVASLPGTYKIHAGITKYILKEVAREFLPDEVIDRPKEGFVLPVYDWLKSDFKEYAYDILCDAALKRYGILEPAFVQGLLKFYYQDPDKNVGVSSLIWSLIMFQNWCNIYM